MCSTLGEWSTIFDDTLIHSPVLELHTEHPFESRRQATSDRGSQDLNKFGEYPIEEVVRSTRVMTTSKLKENILNLYIGHQRFQRLLFQIASFLFASDTELENRYPSALFTEWMRRHRDIMDGPCFQERPPHDMSRQLCDQLKMPRLDTIDFDGKDDNCLKPLHHANVESAFSAAEEARVLFCVAFEQLYEVAQVLGKVSVVQGNTFLQWFTHDWCAKGFEIGACMRCPLEFDDLPGLGTRVMLALKRSAYSENQNIPSETWLAEIQLKIQLHDTRIAQLKCLHNILESSSTSSSNEKYKVQRKMHNYIRRCERYKWNARINILGGIDVD